MSYFIYLFFLRLDLQPMELPWLGVELKLQLPAYTTTMPDLRHVYDLHHSSQQHLTLSPERSRESNLHLHGY